MNERQVNKIYQPGRFVIVDASLKILDGINLTPGLQRRVTKFVTFFNERFVEVDVGLHSAIVNVKNVTPVLEVGDEVVPKRQVKKTSREDYSQDSLCTITEIFNDNKSCKLHVALSDNVSFSLNDFVSLDTAPKFDMYEHVKVNGTTHGLIEGLRPGMVGIMMDNKLEWFDNEDVEHDEGKLAFTFAAKSTFTLNRNSTSLMRRLEAVDALWLLDTTLNVEYVINDGRPRPYVAKVLGYPIDFSPNDIVAFKTIEKSNTSTEVTGIVQGSTVTISGESSTVTYNVTSFLTNYREKKAVVESCQLVDGLTCVKVVPVSSLRVVPKITELPFAKERAAFLTALDEIRALGFVVTEDNPTLEAMIRGRLGAVMRSERVPHRNLLFWVICPKYGIVINLVLNDNQLVVELTHARSTNTVSAEYVATLTATKQIADILLRAMAVPCAECESGDA